MHTHTHTQHTRTHTQVVAEAVDQALRGDVDMLEQDIEGNHTGASRVRGSPYTKGAVVSSFSQGRTTFVQLEFVRRHRGHRTDEFREGTSVHLEGEVGRVEMVGKLEVGKHYRLDAVVRFQDGSLRREPLHLLVVRSESVAKTFARFVCFCSVRVGCCDLFFLCTLQRRCQPGRISQERYLRESYQLPHQA